MEDMGLVTSGITGFLESMMLMASSLPQPMVRSSRRTLRTEAAGDLLYFHVAVPGKFR